MPDFALHPQSLLMETIWLSRWSERLLSRAAELRKEEAERVARGEASVAPIIKKTQKKKHKKTRENEKKEEKRKKKNTLMLKKTSALTTLSNAFTTFTYTGLRR
jgi:hypothetical protein